MTGIEETVHAYQKWQAGSGRASWLYFRNGSGEPKRAFNVSMKLLRPSLRGHNLDPETRNLAAQE